MKFSKCFLSVKFRTKFEVVQQKQFLSVVANHSKSNFSTINLVVFSEEIREVYSTEIFPNTAKIREVTCVDKPSLEV